jgi:ATP-binding cassette, subfamily B, bacterial
MIVVSSIVTAAAIAGQLLVGRELLDFIAQAGRFDAGDLAFYLAALAALLMVSAMSQALANELRIPLGERVHRRAMDEILDVATEVDVEAYERVEFHDRMQRAQGGAGSYSSSVVFGLVTIVSTLVVTLGVIAVLVTVAPILVPFAVLGYAPIAYVNLRNNRARYQMEWDLTELERERLYLEHLLTQRAESNEIRAYGIAAKLRFWHAALWEERLRRLRELIRRRLILTSGGTLVTTAVLVATLSFALLLAGRGDITIGEAAVAIVGLQQLSSRLKAAGNAFNGVHQGVVFLRDFETFRSTLPILRQKRPTGVPPTPPRTLTVERLTYRYPGSTDDAIRSVAFELERGQSIAIVGANGSGKTTLAKLLCGLLPPTAGTIRWDGVDISTCDPALVRAQIAPVFQDFARYMFTIRQVIGLGYIDDMDNEERMTWAASQVGVDELATSHVAGYDARLGKLFSGGTDISVGQWQRLAIARALFRDAPIVILDEPSASLDPQSESELFDLVQSLCHDRIVVFVSHRLATVRTADVVMVLDQGEVVEFGSHDDLLARGGLYHSLFRLQADRYGFTH